MSTSAPPSSGPPRPVYTGSTDDGRLVPRDWLDQAPVTRTLLALNIAMFVVEVVAQRSVAFSDATQLRFGASYALATVGENRWETLVTACFLHGGIVHLVFNMVVLWQAGPLVERAVGSARMAPMYLLAGAFGNALSVLYGMLTRSGMYTVGASGAISGIVGAALVVGWRVQGWKGPLTQAMARWLGLTVAFGLLVNFSRGRIQVDNAAHIGGALAGAAIASMWKRGYKYSPAATKAVLATCVGVLAACIAVVAVHDQTDPFASMTEQARQDFTMDAVYEGRCRDAHDGLLATERLRRGRMMSLRRPVEATCGHVGE